jgi:hypothetical protein
MGRREQAVRCVKALGYVYEKEQFDSMAYLNT